MAEQDRLIVLITGANSGIGYETSKALLDSPLAYTIIVGGRSMDKINTAIKALKKELPNSKSDMMPLQVDLVSDESMEKAAKEVEMKFGRIDALVNNAGATFDSVMDNDKSSASIRAAFNRTYDVNLAGTQVMTHLFMPLLLNSSDPRLLFITSAVSSLSAVSAGRASAMSSAGYPPSGWPKPGTALTAYISSKVALNMVMLEWTRQLKNDGVKVWCVSPGFLATCLLPDMAEKGAAHPSLGGRFIRSVIEGERDADVGTVVDRTGVQPW